MYDVKKLKELVHAKDVPAIRAFMAAHDLVVEGGKIVPRPETRKEYEQQSEFWNQRQQARKILLNSLYGALLNEAMRMYDPRLGQSVTLTGRSIVRHMNAKTNETITGSYDYRGDAIVYADTDSCYFSVVPILRNDPDFKEFDWTRESFIELYDGIADVVNESFPEFMAASFHTTLARGGIIKAGRELVASKALFIVKKKYACLMYDKEGDRLDTGNKPGKLKAMGLDLKRADTPKYMQRFLEEVLMDLLTGSQKNEIFDKVKVFRRDFTDRPAWEMGSPKAVKALSDYSDKLKKATGGKITEKGGGKVNMPGHVRAALNWNRLCDVNNDRYSMRISDGFKIIVCKLKPNNLYRMDSVAYPIDEPHLPDWFKALPFDKESMEQSIIDKKLDNLLGVLEWDLSETVELSSDQFFKFG